MAVRVYDWHWLPTETQIFTSDRLLKGEVFSLYIILRV